MNFNLARGLEGALVGAILSALPVLDPLTNGQPINPRSIAIAFAATVIIGVVKSLGQTYQGSNVSITPPPGSTTVTETTVIPSSDQIKKA